MSCSSDCFSGAVQTILLILTKVLSTSFPTDATQIIMAIVSSVNTIICEFPSDLKTQIVNQLSKLNDISSNTVKYNNLAYILVIFIVLFLLVIFQYLTKYYDWIVILSLITVVVGGIVLFFILNSINQNTINESVIVLTDLQNLLSQVQTSLSNGISCFGVIGDNDCINCCKSC